MHEELNEAAELLEQLESEWEEAHGVKVDEALNEAENSQSEE